MYNKYVIGINDDWWNKISNVGKTELNTITIYKYLGSVVFMWDYVLLSDISWRCRSLLCITYLMYVQTVTSHHGKTVAEWSHRFICSNLSMGKKWLHCHSFPQCVKQMMGNQQHCSQRKCFQRRCCFLFLKHQRPVSLSCFLVSLTPSVADLYFGHVLRRHQLGHTLLLFYNVISGIISVARLQV